MNHHYRTKDTTVEFVAALIIAIVCVGGVVVGLVAVFLG